MSFALLLAATIHVALVGDSSPTPDPDQWRFRVHTDEMTDKKVCIVSTQIPPEDMDSLDDGSPIFFFKLNDVNIELMDADFPGRQIVVRVDKNEAFKADEYFDAEQSKTLIDQIRKGQILRTRYYRWPNDFPIDREYSLKYLPAALDSCIDKMKNP